MSIYKAIVQYKGTHYKGFQVQPNDRTIQGEIHKALEIISKTNEIKTIGSGRTDAGVHALGQVLKIEIPVDVPGPNLAKALNSLLPTDIRVISSEIVLPEFHPIYSAQSKEYHYVFSTAEILSPLVNEIVTSFPFELNLALMNDACKIFEGEHDFLNYQCTGTDVDTSVRTIFKCEVSRTESSGHWSHLVGEYYVLKIVGNGFLKQMVRLIMGALVNVGREKISLKQVEDSLKNKLDNRLGATAPPQGLYLVTVNY